VSGRTHRHSSRSAGILPRVGDDDKVPEKPAREERGTEGGSDASDDWKEVFLHSRDRPPDEATAALMGRFATDLQNLTGIDASRIKAILRGAEATDDEVERIGYACIELMRALRDE
jgi:hypothetical protein